MPDPLPSLAHLCRLARIDPDDLAAERSLARIEAVADGADPDDAERLAVAALIVREGQWVTRTGLETDLGVSLDDWPA